MKKKIFIILGIILMVIVVIFVTGLIMINQAAKSIGIGSGEVADYNKKISIWNTVAGNSNESKIDDMNIKYKENAFITTIKFINGIVNTEYKDAEQAIDTYTYLYEIKNGFEKETYEDEPYLIPYLVENSDIAVIVIPGGGFGYKSMDGSTGEGKDIAEKLNENGINAFVLHYRSNPYEYPVPYLDLQRAIKYLKYNSEKYGIDKNKITMIGFSAGGNLITHYINKIQNNDIYPEGYIKDEIDEIDSTISVATMIYPATTFNYNVPMLFAMFEDEDVRDNSKRKELLDLMDNIKNFNSSDVKQFVVYGDKDTMVGTDETPKYIKTAKEQGTDITSIIVENGEHGFGTEYYFDGYIKWLTECFD